MPCRTAPKQLRNQELVEVVGVLRLQQEVPLGLRVVRVAGGHAFLLHVEALGRGRELAGGRTDGRVRMGTYAWGGARTSYPRGKSEYSPSSVMSPLVDLALPAEGVDLFGRHVDHLPRRGRHHAEGLETHGRGAQRA